MGGSQLLLGDVLRLADCVRCFDQRVQPGPGNAERARCGSDLPTICLRLRRGEEAERELQRSLGAAERALGRTSWLYFQVLDWIGEVRLARGDARGAIAYASQSSRIGATVLGPAHPGLAYPLLLEGEAQLAAGAPAKALGPITRSLEIRDAATASASERAESCFALARALVAAGQDRGRAYDLARRARDLYARQGKGGEQRLRDIERWLAQPQLTALQAR